jgi:tetratricopeptide (TPR) repeat protein
MALNRLDEAQAALESGLTHGVDPEELAGTQYSLAFLRNDVGLMQKQVALAAGKPGSENAMLAEQADTEAYHGHFKQAQEYSRRAVDSARRNGTQEVAAGWAAEEAFREAETGNSAFARQAAAATLQLAPRGRYVQAVAALALARSGDTAQAPKLADDLAKRYPEDTQVVAFWLPAARASMEINRRNPAKAVELLRVTQPYELGEPVPYLTPMGPVYLRGHAYLNAGQGKEAAEEFRKILDHRGIVQNTPIAMLAQVGLGRALAASGNPAAARVAYQDFLTLWNDADPDIPLLKQAKSEYAKLQ